MDDKLNKILAIFLILSLQFNLLLAQDCTIQNVIAEPHPCTPNGIFYVDIDFEFENVGESGFRIQGNGNNYGNFEYAQEFVTLGPFEGDGNTALEFVVIDNDNPNCSDFVELEPINCLEEPCEIGDLEVHLTDCDEDGDYDLELNFEYANVDNVGFDFYINNEFFDFYSYNDLPLNLSDLELNFGNAGVSFKVCENDLPDCCSSFFLEAPHDCPPDSDCLAFENFEQEVFGTSTNVVPGEVIYVENDIPLSIHPYIDIEQESVFGDLIILDANGHPNFNTAEGDYILVEGINVKFSFSNYPTTVESLCLDLYRDYGGINLAVNDGEILFFDTYPEEVISLANGIEASFERSENDPNLAKLTITGAIEYLWIGGLHLGMDNLCINTELDCELSDLNLTHTACNDNNQYYVQVDFDYSHVADSFYLWTESSDTLLFAYADLPLQLGAFQGPNEDSTVVYVVDQLDAACMLSDTLYPVSCEEECYIEITTLEATECNEEGEFKILLDFESEYTGLYFHVIINNEFFGEYHYNETPLYLGPFEGDGTTEWNIEIYDQSETCNASGSLPPVSCPQECTINNIVVEPHTCEEGLFYVDLAFDAINNGAGGYIVFADGEISGPHSYEESFITLGPFEGDGSTVLDFLILDLEDPTCFGYAELTSIDCNECEIFDLVVDPGQCNEDGTYQLYINFEYEGADNEYFDVISANGEYIAYYPLAELPITIENFPASGNAYDYVKVCINDNPNCCTQIEFEAPDCVPNEECEIYDIIVETLECDGEGTYSLILDFEFQNNVSSNFSVLDGNGNIIGTYAFADLPVTVQNFPERPNNEYDFIKIIDNDSDCYGVWEFMGPDCGANNNECEIYDLVVDPGQCNEDGTYQLYINFEYEGAENDYFDVIDDNGNFIAYFELADLPVTLENFPASGNAYDYVKVCINDTPGCCADIEFEAPDCEPNGNCNLYDLIYELHECNEEGQFYVDLDFLFSNVGEEGFRIQGNGNNYGNFSYEEEYVTLGPFDGDGQTVYEFIIIDNQHPNCVSNYVEFTAPNCGNNVECDIYDIVVETLECDGEGTYSLILDFEFQNNVSSNFSVLDGNGNIIGTYAFADLPVTVQNFPERPNNEYDYIKIRDNDSDCYAEWEFMGPDCGANNNECEIYDIVVETLECDGEGTYSLILDFEFQNNVSSNFSVLDGNGNIISTYAFADLPVTVQNFPERPNNEYDYIKIRDNDSDCYAEWEFMGPDCGANNNECEIFDLVIDLGQCNEDGTYQIYINFEYEGAENDYFDVIDNNGNFIAYFELADLPVTLENFPASGNAYDYLKVCINDTPGCCADIEFEAPDCEPGLVWPGDANTDRIAQNFDLLNIGIAYGFEGPDRQEMGNDWLGLEAEDWEESFADDVNFKHADCNGDGVVDIEDREAILLNYNETHGTPTPFEPLPSTDLDPPIFVDFPEPGDLENGDAFEVPVILGTEDEPVNDIYGIAFTIEFDPEFIDPESLEIIYPTSWFGEEDINMITLDKKFTDDGRLEVAMTRIDQNDVSGFGQVAMLIGIIDDIAGVHDTEVGISDIHGLAYDQSPVTLKAPAERIVLAPEMPQDTVGWLDLKRSLTVFPNPSNSWVNVHTRHGYDIQELSVLRPDGQEVVPTVVNQSRISIKELPEGIYILRIKVLDEVFHEKIIKAD